MIEEIRQALNKTQIEERLQQDSGNSTFVFVKPVKNANGVDESFANSTQIQ